MRFCKTNQAPQSGGSRGLLMREQPSFQHRISWKVPQSHLTARKRVSTRNSASYHRYYDNEEHCILPCEKSHPCFPLDCGLMQRRSKKGAPASKRCLRRHLCCRQLALWGDRRRGGEGFRASRSLRREVLRRAQNRGLSQALSSRGPPSPPMAPAAMRLPE